jgi:hypothetical protein
LWLVIEENGAFSRSLGQVIVANRRVVTFVVFGAWEYRGNIPAALGAGKFELTESVPPSSGTA